jgi:hypothetical protein
MQLTFDRARAIGEALLDAADSAETTGRPHYVEWSDDLNTAISVPSVLGLYELLYIVDDV